MEEEEEKKKKKVNQVHKKEMVKEVQGVHHEPFYDWRKQNYGTVLQQKGHKEVLRQ